RGYDPVASCVEYQIDISRGLRRRPGLVEQVEEPDANLKLLLRRDAEVLEQRQIVIDTRRHTQVVLRNQVAVFAERRDLDAVDVQDLRAGLGVAGARIARVNRREPT